MRSQRRWRIVGPILGISLATLGVVTGVIVSGRWTFCRPALVPDGSRERNAINGQ